MKAALRTSFFLTLTLLLSACTEMEDYLFEEAPEINYASEAELIISLKEAYAELYPVMNHIYFLQEVAADQLVIPARAGSNLNSDMWQRLHTHDYRAGDEVVKAGWSFIQRGINSCNRLLYRYEEHVPYNQNIAALCAEVRAVRALFCWWALDLYGQLPEVELEKNQSKPDSRFELYRFCVNELENNAGLLSKAVDATTYSRMNYWSAKMLLAKLYLNAEAYTGQPAWEHARDALAEIIESGQFSLEPDYFDNFSINNHHSPEIIFAIPYDEQRAPGFQLNAITWATDGTALNAAGLCATPGFYNSFEAQDIRRLGLITDAEGYKSGIRSLSNAEADAGARIGKFESVGKLNMSNDFPLFRYADALLMYAEALWRVNPSDGQALLNLNQLRQRAGLESFTQLTAEKLLAERGRELYAEMHRRTDLIRFGQYGAAWWGKLENRGSSTYWYPVLR